MKKFIKKIYYFIFLFIIFLIIITILPKQFGSLKVNNAKNMIVIGNSHSECAFNDSIINGLFNLSRSGEDYFNNYYKLKEFLNQNSQFKTIFVEFSNSDINKSRDNWIWGNIGEPSIYHRKLAKYALFMDWEGLCFLYKKNSTYVMGDILPFFKNNLTLFFNVFNHLYNKFGGYYYLKRNKTDSLVANLDNIKVEFKKTLTSDANIEYLKKIVNLCNENKVKLYFVRTPQHKFSKIRKNEQTFMNIKDSLFNNIELLDFNDFPLQNNEYGDLEHLNHSGAKVFSKWFNELLKKGILSEMNKNEFINNEIEQVRTHNTQYKKLGRK